MAIDSRVIAVTEKAKREVTTTVNNLQRLGREKLHLVEEFSALTTKQASLDQREAILEQLLYQLRIEARYLRILQVNANKSLRELHEYQQRLSSLSVTSTQAPMKSLLQTLFDRIESAARQTNDLLQAAGNKVAKETLHVTNAEGRHLFSESFDPNAYREFLKTWAEENEIELRILRLNLELERVGNEMQAVGNALDPNPSLTTTMAIGVGMIALLAAGYSLLGVIAAIVGIGTLGEYLSRKEFLRRWQQLG